MAAKETIYYKKKHIETSVFRAYIGIFNNLWAHGLLEKTLAIGLALAQLTILGFVITLYYAHHSQHQDEFRAQEKKVLSSTMVSHIDILPVEPGPPKCMIPPVIFTQENPLELSQEAEVTSLDLATLLGVESDEEPAPSVNTALIVYAYESCFLPDDYLYDGMLLLDRMRSLRNLSSDDTLLRNEAQRKLVLLEKVPEHLYYHIVPKRDSAPLSAILTVSLLNGAVLKRASSSLGDVLDHYLKEDETLFADIKDRARHDHGLKAYAENCIMKLNALCQHFYNGGILRKDSVVRAMEQLNKPQKMFSPPINDLQDCLFGLKLLIVEQKIKECKGNGKESDYKNIDEFHARLSDPKKIFSEVMKYNPFSLELNTCDLSTPESQFTADGTNRTAAIIETAPGVLEIFSRSQQRPLGRNGKTNFSFESDGAGYGQTRTWHLASNFS